jgi:hypothetical protein
MVTVFWGDNPLFDFYSHETPEPPVLEFGGSNQYVKNRTKDEDMTLTKPESCSRIQSEAQAIQADQFKRASSSEPVQASQFKHNRKVEQP